MKTIQDLYDYAETQNLKLEVQNFDKEYICIEHLDESYFKITNAKIETHYITLENWSDIDKNKKEVIIIFSEHHEPFVYFKEDLKSIKIKEKIKTKH